MGSRIHQGSLRNRWIVISTRLIRPLIGYKEICYSAAIGASVWIVDAVMHASQQGRLSWGGFVRELAASDSAQLLFRALFVAVAVAFGFSLWRSNQRRRQVDELREAADLLHRQIASPLLLIVGYCQMLSLKQGWPVGREAAEIIAEIHINARKINETIKHLPPPGAPIQEKFLTGLPMAESRRDEQNRQACSIAAEYSASPTMEQSHCGFGEAFCPHSDSDLTSPVNLH